MLNLTCPDFDVITHAAVEKDERGKKKGKDGIRGILRKDTDMLNLRAERESREWILSGGHLSRAVCPRESAVTFCAQTLEGKSHAH